MASKRERKRRHRIYLIRERAKHPLLPPTTAKAPRRWGRFSAPEFNDPMPF